MPDELCDPAAVVELVGFWRIGSLVHESNSEPFIQEREFTQTLRERVVIELRHIHDGGVRLKRDFRAGLLPRLAGARQRTHRNAALVFLFPRETFAHNLEL